MDHRSDMTTTEDSIGDRRAAASKLRVEAHSPPSSDAGDSCSDREEDDARVVQHDEVPAPPPLGMGWSSHPVPGGCSNRRRLLSKTLSMKETSREAKWEKRRRQILRRGGMVSVVHGGGRSSAAAAAAAVPQLRQVVRSSSERVRARCLTDEDLDELRGSFELGFGFDEDAGGAHLRDTLPALDFYFAVNRQLSDPKLRTLAPSPTSTLSAVSSASTLPDTPSPRSPSAAGDADEAWKLFSPGDNPQLVKTRLRHWAQVVACSIKHGC